MLKSTQDSQVYSSPFPSFLPPSTLFCLPFPSPSLPLSFPNSSQYLPLPFLFPLYCSLLTFPLAFSFHGSWWEWIHPCWQFCSNLAIFTVWTIPLVNWCITLMLHNITSMDITDFLIFCRDVAERIWYGMVICYSTPPCWLMSLHYMGKHEPWKLDLFNHAVFVSKTTLLWLAISLTFINQF